MVAEKSTYDALCESGSKLYGGRERCIPLHFASKIFEAGSAYVCAWENRFGVDDGKFQMHVHMMCGINHRNNKVLTVDSEWNVRAWAKICYNIMMDLSLLGKKGDKLRTLLSDTGGGGSNILR